MPSRMRRRCSSCLPEASTGAACDCGRMADVYKRFRAHGGAAAADIVCQDISANVSWRHNERRRQEEPVALPG